MNVKNDKININILSLLSKRPLALVMMSDVFILEFLNQNILMVHLTDHD